MSESKWCGGVLKRNKKKKVRGPRLRNDTLKRGGRQLHGYKKEKRQSGSPNKAGRWSFGGTRPKNVNGNSANGNEVVEHTTMNEEEGEVV